MKNEIVLYRTNELPEHVEVRLGEDTVWLNQEQISGLFQRDQSVVSRHIRNIFAEGELDEKSNMQKMHITNSDKLVAFYNLDVIISVGYRVKSIRGTHFRIWANSVLKEFLLKGYAVNQRFERIEKDVFYLKERVNEFDFQIRTNLPPNEGIFFDGQVFDAYIFVVDLIKSAKESIVLIDNYIDESVLSILSKNEETVNITIYTLNITKQLQLDLKKHNEQYNYIEIKTFTKSHDRFLIIDKKAIYHIGASLKDLGKKWFAFSKINLNPDELISKLS